MLQIQFTDNTDVLRDDMKWYSDEIDDSGKTGKIGEIGEIGKIGKNNCRLVNM